jgi:hypothetical protein
MQHVLLEPGDGSEIVMLFIAPDPSDEAIERDIAMDGFDPSAVKWRRISPSEAHEIQMRNTQPKRPPAERDPSMIGVGVMHDIAPEVADAVNQMAGIIRELSEDRENDKQRIAALEAVIEAIKDRALAESGEA